VANYSADSDLEQYEPDIKNYGIQDFTLTGNVYKADTPLMARIRASEDAPFRNSAAA